jgi:endonuclease/exonuclease/phosphatase family metal-dependent hydrolase
MKHKITRLAITLVAIAVTSGLSCGCQHLAKRPPVAIETVKSAQRPLPAASPILSVVQWNLGYAGLGFDSDFRADGGRMVLPPSGRAVDRNLKGITDRLSSMPADIYALQEVAESGFLTRGRDVLGGVKMALVGADMVFSRDIDNRLLKLRHGLVMAGRIQHQKPFLVRLPDEPNLLMGIVERQYHVQVMQLEADGQPWSFINLHLSAFDDGAVRAAQLRAVLTLVQQEAAKGHHVVALGDWNMRLTSTNFAYSADPKAQFWIRDFPQDQIPQGWQLVFDPRTPTVRTNEQTYISSRNYTTIIDGALVSPGVEVVSVETMDTGFVDTDHQPVRFQFRAKAKASP